MAKAQILLQNNRATVTQNADTKEVTVQFDISGSDLRSTYELKKMIKAMGININTALGFKQASLTYEECNGDFSQIILSCTSYTGKMTLTNSAGQSFEIVVHGKASSRLKIDKTYRSCGSEIKSSNTFDLNYSGDYITVNGISTRDIQFHPEDEINDRQITHEFLFEFADHVASTSVYEICF